MAKELRTRCSHCKVYIKYQFGSKPVICPECKHIYSMKPPMEYNLFCLQDKFLRFRDNKEIANEFFTSLYKYVYILILKKLKGKLSLNKNVIKDKVIYTLDNLYRYYCKEEFRIEGSFAGYINCMLLDTLYKRKDRRDNDHDSLNSLMQDKKSEKLNNLMTIGFRHILENEIDVEKAILDKDRYIITKILDIIDFMGQSIKDYINTETYFYYLLGLMYIMEGKNKLFIDKYYDYIGTDTTRYIQKTIGVIYERLKNSVDY